MAKAQPNGPGSGQWQNGLKSLERRLREGRLDRKSRIARQWRKRVLEWAEDDGGMVNLTNREMTLLWHTAGISLLIDSMLEHAFSQSSPFTANGTPNGASSEPCSKELLAYLRTSLLAYANTERRGLEALGLKPKRDHQVPDLAAYIEAASKPAEPVVADEDASGDKDSDPQEPV